MVGQKFNYDELHKLWDDTFPKNKIVFAMYDIDEEDNLYPEVDFTSTELIVKGEFEFHINTWRYEGTWHVVKGKDLTWKKMVTLLNRHNDRHHIFLELLEIEGDIVKTFLGS